MSSSALALSTGAASLLLSVLLPFAVRPMLVRLGIVDVPNERSSHERPVLRGLGLAVFIAIGLVGIAATSWFGISDPHGANWKFLLTITIGTLLSGLLGLSEDIRGLSVPVRSAALLAIAASASLAIVLLARSTDRGGVPGLNAGELPTWVLIGFGLYAIPFISSYINVANFMDGLNGISGFHGVIAGLTFAAAGALSAQPWLIVAGVVLAAAWAGFLPWNLTKPGAFAGDVGSYLLGGAVSMTSFAALLTGVPVLATIGPMVIYFGDVGTTLVKRVRAGHKWDEPHKEHAYQRLQQSGLTHVAASGVNAAFTLAASVLGLASFFVSPIWWLLLLAGGLTLVIVYQILPSRLTKP